MTVYNVTKLLSRQEQLAIKAFLNVNKITITYSDCLCEFGIRLTKPYSYERRKIVIKKINDTLMTTPVNILEGMPIINNKEI